MDSLRFNNKYRIPSARLQHWNYANAAMYFVTICTQNRVNYFGDIVAAPTVDDGDFDCGLRTHVETRCNGVVETRCNGVVETRCNGVVETRCNGVVETRCIASLPAFPHHNRHNHPNHHPTLQPTEIGKIAHLEWYKSVELRPDMNLELGEFIVMPNHIHGIVIIGANEYNTPGNTGIGGNVGSGNAGSGNAGSGNAGSGNAESGNAGRDAMHRVSTSASASASATKYQNQFAPQSKNIASIIRGYKSAVTTYARKNNIEFNWQPRFHDHIIRSPDEYHRISNYILNNPAKWLEDKFYAP